MVGKSKSQKEGRMTAPLALHHHITRIQCGDEEDEEIEVCPKFILKMINWIKNKIHKGQEV